MVNGTYIVIKRSVETIRARISHEEYVEVRMNGVIVLLHLDWVQEHLNMQLTPYWNIGWGV